MTALERIGAGELAATMVAYRDALRRHQDAINSMNVFPVPDGDTGTNMALTMESVVNELEAGPDAGARGGPGAMAAVCGAISHGSLMGARGNSGVVLCQFLRGMADILSVEPEAGAAEVAASLLNAASSAYQAVMRPVEGTILTVAREAAERADAASRRRATLLEVLEEASGAARDALRATPELLPVLAEAGVVDAGGAGLVLLVDALLFVVAKKPLPEPADGAAAGGMAAVPVRQPAENLRYEVMYLLEAPDEAVPSFKEVWAGIGDSIVVVGGEGLWNCHIHTDDIGAAVEAALDAGRPSRIQVTDLRDQVEEERWVLEGGSETGDAGRTEAPVTAVVAVATGEGLRRIFRSLGVQVIVAGGQSMNPSTAQILEAVEQAPASQVVVLPNNDNIHPVAEQVGSLTAKLVRVVRTRDIAGGFAALLAYDPASGADENAAAMADAACRVVSGEVTKAVRDADSPAGPIAAGDWIGLSANGIESVGGSCAEAACGLLGRIVGDDHEIVTLIEGETAGAADTRRITTWLEEHRPAVTVEVHHGGQPLYPYLVSVE